MCDFLSAWINIKTEEIVCADAMSHAGTQKQMGWSSTDLTDWREFKWTGPGEDNLTVRVCPGDKRNANWWRAIIIARYGTWHIAVEDLCVQAVRRTGRLSCVIAESATRSPTDTK